MLVQYVPQLSQKRIILASASPRRSEILKNIGLKFEVLVSNFDEKLPHSRFPNAADYAIETARHKALDIASRFVGPPSPGTVPVELVIGADTVVDLGSHILEKPEDAQDAFRMLSSLSGRSHQVHTAVVLVLPRLPDPATGKPPFVRAFAATTDVEFDSLTKETLDAYIASGEPFGKAGSYGIQGMAGAFVKSLRGCYFNVMGFPLNRFSSEVSQLIKEGLITLD